MLNLNARSIWNKCDELEGLLITHDPDVTVITETWLNEAIPDTEVIPNTHEIVRQDRSKRGGGVAIVIKKGLDYRVIPHNTGIEMAWILLRFCNLNILIGSVYRTPDADVSVLEQLHDFLGEHRRRYTHVVMCGDFNLPKINWELQRAIPSCQHSDVLLDIAFACNLKQIVREPTRLASGAPSVLDLVFITDAIERHGFSVDIIPGISDHEAVLFESNMVRPPAYEIRKPFLDFNNALDESILHLFPGAKLR